VSATALTNQGGVVLRDSLTVATKEHGEKRVQQQPEVTNWALRVVKEFISC